MKIVLEVTKITPTKLTSLNLKYTPSIYKKQSSVSHGIAQDTVESLVSKQVILGVVRYLKSMTLEELHLQFHSRSSSQVLNLFDSVVIF